MGKPILKTDDSILNTSSNDALSEVLMKHMQRRQILKGSAALGVGGLLSQTWMPLAHAAEPNPITKGIQALGFKSVALSTEDRVIVPEGYRADVLYAWGDPVGIKNKMPAFKSDASNTAAEQALQAGMHHDGMAYFPLPFGSAHSKHGLMAINHEYTDDGLLHPDGMETWSEEKVKKAQAAVGVSVIEVEHDRQKGWQVVRPSQFARRITANTPCMISGPARGHHLLQTAADPKGIEVLGTFNNCANGQTPWGTYLTCEENWSDYFANNGTLSEDDNRYGIKNKDSGYRWSEIDFRFDRQITPNESHRFGWVVEIDPFDPKSKPVKRTALGRIKHEGATVTLAADDRIVVYMGDDQRFEYIYKFVSARKYNRYDRQANRDILDKGTLFVARFNGNQQGEWLPLVYGERGLTAEHGFHDQGEVLIKTRQAADVLGATKMDRPEWIAVNPMQAGEVYCTLTNNSERGKDGKPAIDPANPRTNNTFGHIMRWVEHGNDAAATSFTWNIYVLAGNPERHTDDKKGNIHGDVYGSPDGLKFSSNGILWIQTDVSTSTLNQKDYQGMGNNQMLASIVSTGETRRFLTGPNGCELTGIAFTPDNRTMFVNIQHPGEPANERSDPQYPQKVSTWPDGVKGKRPRSATIVIRKEDGGEIGL